MTRHFSYADLASEAEREVKMRQRVYPGWVSGKRMSQAQANERIDMMKEIAVRLRGLAETVEPKDDGRLI